MCRNIRPLFNFEPPATEEEIRASAIQFVRKVSGFSKPAKANAEGIGGGVGDGSAEAGKVILYTIRGGPPGCGAE